jgi:hypothetical protein
MSYVNGYLPASCGGLTRRIGSEDKVMMKPKDTRKENPPDETHEEYIERMLMDIRKNTILIRVWVSLFGALMVLALIVGGCNTLLSI